MSNSGISTLDASDLAYQFEIANMVISQVKDYSEDDILKIVTQKQKVTIPSNLQYVDSFRDAERSSFYRLLVTV